MEDTINAIKESVEHWNEIINGRSDADADKCALCNMFSGNDCENCPIYKKTGERNCYDSPYYAFSDYVNNSFYFELRGKLKVFDEKSQDLAIAERDFLESLLTDYVKTIEKPNRVYAVGDIIEDGRDGELFIISFIIGDEMAGVSLEDGTAWSERLVTVSASGHITQEEFNEMFNKGNYWIHRGNVEDNIRLRIEEM